MRDLKEAALSVITEMLKEEIITPADLLCYRSNEIDTDHPDEVRSQREHWYKTLGVEQITGKPFHLTRPYFYKEEIREFRERGELLCCLPKGLSAKDLSELFHFHTWAESSALVKQNPEEEDCWFFVKKSTQPELLDRTGREIQQVIKKQGDLNLTLERYLVLVASLYAFCGITTDEKYKTWLPNTKYEGRLMLIGGYDSAGQMSFHAWLPQFHSPYVGGRSIRICEHL